MSEKSKEIHRKPILLLLTGGTICSFGDSDNVNRDVDMKKAKRLLTENFRNSSSPYSDAEFETVEILDTLSENMTADKWNILVEYLKTVNFDCYSGIIMAHGTDTLAYTSCLMALCLSGKDIPMCMVSSQLPLDSNGANGNVNFAVAVQLIMEGAGGGVYVPYANTDGKMYIHYGAHLLQCENYLDDFYSYDAFVGEVKENRLDCENIDEVLRERFITGNAKARGRYNVDLSKLEPVKPDVIVIKPYVGLNYEAYNITDSVRAVIHGLYHSCTACSQITEKGQKVSSASILYLIEKCRDKGIPVIIEPCHENVNIYSSGNMMTDAGAEPVYGMTSEMVYVKSLIAGAMKIESQHLADFLRTNICGEIFVTD